MRGGKKSCKDISRCKCVFSGLLGISLVVLKNKWTYPTTLVNEHHSLIPAIRELLSRDWVVQVNHIYREANIAADFLASSSLSCPLGLQLLPVAPPNLQSILRNDVSGVAHSRLVVL